MFSVTSESSATSPVRPEPPRISAQDTPSQPNGFAALVDTNAEPSRPVAADRQDSSQASSRTTRQDRNPREASTDPAAARSDPPRNTENTATDERIRHEAAKPSKHGKSEKTADDSAHASSGQATEAGAATTSASDTSLDPTAIAVAAATVSPIAPVPVPTSAQATSGSATAGPLSIAAAAIATSAQASAMPAAASGNTSSVVEAVEGAAGEVNATNFAIAKTITTTPVPATEQEAEAQPTATPQLASAVAATASKVIKSGDKLPVTHAEATGDATSSDNAAQPPAQQSSAVQPGAAHTNPHPANNPSADATPASATSDIDRAAGDAAAATPQGGHHAPNIASQPTTPDAMSQLGATLAVPQGTATTAIPAAQLTATPVTNLAMPVSGLAVQIAASARAGNSRFEIRLDPAELGRIDVRLDVDRHGNVTSHLTVEKPETLAMLRQDAPQLQRSLEDAGLKTGQNGLQFSLRDQSSGQQNNNHGQAERQPQRLVIGETTAVPLVAANITYSYAASANRGLDIRV